MSGKPLFYNPPTMEMVEEFMRAYGFARVHFESKLGYSTLNIELGEPGGASAEPSSAHTKPRLITEPSPMMSGAPGRKL